MSNLFFIPNILKLIKQYNYFYEHNNIHIYTEVYDILPLDYQS